MNMVPKRERTTCNNGDMMKKKGAKSTKGISVDENENGAICIVSEGIPSHSSHFLGALMPSGDGKTHQSG